VLARSDEYRKNEMTMLEEFRRRKKLKDYFELMKERQDKKDFESGLPRSANLD
jgi:hypothetical protein